MQFSPKRLQFEYLNDEVFDLIYLSAVEAAEDAVLNALVGADDMTTLRPPGKFAKRSIINNS